MEEIPFSVPGWSTTPNFSPQAEVSASQLNWHSSRFASPDQRMKRYQGHIKIMGQDELQIFTSLWSTSGHVAWRRSRTSETNWKLVVIPGFSWICTARFDYLSIQLPMYQKWGRWKGLQWYPTAPWSTSWASSLLTKKVRSYLARIRRLAGVCKLLMEMECTSELCNEKVSWFFICW